MSRSVLSALGFAPELSGQPAGSAEAPPQERMDDPVLAPILAALGNERGISHETAIAIIAVLAGQSCARIGLMRHRATEPGQDPAPTDQRFRAWTAGGSRHVAGDWVDQWLLVDPMSFCRLVVTAADQFGATCLPRIDDALRHSQQAPGTPAFAVPRVAGARAPAQGPTELLHSVAPHFVSRLAQLGDQPEDVPVALAFNAQTLMRTGRAVLDPGTAARISIDYAIPASRIHPDDL